MKFAEFEFELKTDGFIGLDALLCHAADFSNKVRWTANGTEDTPMSVTIYGVNKYLHPLKITAEEIEGVWRGKVERLPLDDDIDLSGFGLEDPENDDLLIDSINVYDEDTGSTVTHTVEEFIRIFYLKE